VIERSVILSSGKRLHIPKDALPQPLHEASQVLPMSDAERRHILEALTAAHWVVGGPKGAATLLGMKRSTLQSRMQKLGIRRARR
jgi:formate hydrogenlyase transcriptional activator